MNSNSKTRKWNICNSKTYKLLGRKKGLDGMLNWLESIYANSQYINLHDHGIDSLQFLGSFSWSSNLFTAKNNCVSYPWIKIACVPSPIPCSNLAPHQRVSTARIREREREVCVCYGKAWVRQLGEREWDKKLGNGVRIGTQIFGKGAVAYVSINYSLSGSSLCQTIFQWTKKNLKMIASFHF